MENIGLLEKGQSKESAIVLDKEPEQSETVDEVVAVQGSPLKVLTAPKYRDVIDILDSPEKSVMGDETNEDSTPCFIPKRLKFDLQMYEEPPVKYSAERIIRILLQPDVSKICSVRPTSVSKSSTYVVDVRNLENQDDIKKDDFGIWKYSGSHPKYYKVFEKEDSYLQIDKCAEGATGRNVVLLIRLHCTHPSCSNFKRLICFLTDGLNRPHHLCLVVYRFPSGFIPSLSAHGNSKEKKPFFPTWPSTMDKIKTECLDQGPKGTICLLSTAAGGIMGASAPGQLPRDEGQISRMRKKEKLKGRQSGVSNPVKDDLFALMQRAYTEDPLHKFVRAIQAAPDPAIVLADDAQLVDMERFCTSSLEFGIVTVDPTFTLGEFDVTPVTYRHLLLKTKRNEKLPVFLGPILIHYRKTFSTYLFFASTLVGLSRQLEGIRAFGTDGEEALADAFAHELRFSQRLTCFIHVRRNIKEKLKDCNIPMDLSQKILDDIFGKKCDGMLIEGIVDASESDFDAKLQSLVQLWRSHAVPSGAKVDQFIDYFVDKKARIIRETMIRSVREGCGLGCPPDIFTTNASESMNAVLKRKVDYKRNQLLEFVDILKEVIDDQQCELERAIIGRGKYLFRQAYCHLQVPETKWFAMSSEQRQRHISHIQSVQIVAAKANALPMSEVIQLSSTPSQVLSVDVEHASVQTSIPVNCLRGVWQKANDLLQSSNAIVTAPGQDERARMVLSYTSNAPHMVIPKKGGDFSCDANCPNWKSLGLCSHTVAVAEVNHNLATFLAARRKKKKQPGNLTNLLTATMPRGRGRKGGSAPRSRKPPQPVTCRVEMSVTSTAPVTKVCGWTPPCGDSYEFTSTDASTQFNVVQPQHTNRLPLSWDGLSFVSTIQPDPSKPLSTFSISISIRIAFHCMFYWWKYFHLYWMQKQVLKITIPPSRFVYKAPRVARVSIPQHLSATIKIR